jgi:uncharacterized protein involved in outer membrane biogenesis
VARVSAELDLSSLFHGVLRFRKVTVVHPKLILERNADGVGNWRFRDGSIRFARQDFPDVLDLSLEDADFRYRELSDPGAHIVLRDLRIASSDDRSPVEIEAEGTYNDVSAKLQVRTGSLSDFRNVSAPFGVVGSLSNASIASQFEGTLMDPLNFDGVHGEFALKTQRLTDALRIVGHVPPPRFRPQCGGQSSGLAINGDYRRRRES